MDKQLFAKLINGELEIAPHHYQDDDTYIMNFDECEELMIQYGYKPVIGECPDYNNSQEIHITYREEKECIKRIYELIEKANPQFEVNSIDLEEKIEDEKYEELIKENEELKNRINTLEEKQQEIFNMINSFINECIGSMNKVDELDSKMDSIENNINSINDFIELYNLTKRN